MLFRDVGGDTSLLRMLLEPAGPTSAETWLQIPAGKIWVGKHWVGCPDLADGLLKCESISLRFWFQVK